MLTTHRPKKADSRREWFKYQLRLNKSSLSAIAKELNVSRAAVSRGILNPSVRLADAVAKALGKTKADLWPAKFNSRSSL